MPARAAAWLAPAALLLAALAFAAPAAAQTEVTLVGNDEQGAISAQAGTYERVYATSFTTGSASRGYVLKRVDLWSEQSDTAAFTGTTSVNIYTDDSGVPGTWLGKGFTEPDAETTTSWAAFQHDVYAGLYPSGPIGIDLAPDTTYWVVASGTSSTAANLANYLIGGTSSDAEDSGGQSGWSIGDHRLWSQSAPISWSTANTNPNALRLKLVGHAVSEPLRRSWAGPVSGRMGTDGRTLTLYYGEALDGSSVPAASDFTVKVASTDREPGSVAVAGSTVTLTLQAGHAAAAGAAVTVSYDPAAATSPLRTRAGDEVGRLSGLPVANDRNARGVPKVSGVSIVSTPSMDADGDNTPETYGAGVTVQVALAFSEKVTVDPPSARPRLKIKLHASAAASERWAVYESGSGTETLVFAYEVASGDTSSDGTTDGGIAVVENSLELDGGLIRYPWSGLAASLAHAELAHDAGHKVDGSSESVAPAFESATVDGAALTVTFDEDLDSGSLPAGSSFRVSATPPGGSARSLNGSSATTTLVSGSSSELEVVLSEAVRPGEAVTVAYTKPASNPLQDASSNAVATFSGKPATNATAMPAVPTVVKAAAEDADDNSLKGGSLRVTWTAPSGSLTGYELRYYKGTADPPAGRESDWVEDAAGLPAPDGTANETTITGLTASTAYRVQVRAANGPGRSPWSASASATTAAAASTNNAPRVLRNNGNTSGNVCSVVDNEHPTKLELFHIAQGGVIASFPDLVGVRNTATDAWPSACNTGPQANRRAPVFDDVDEDKLVLHAEPDPVPDNVRVHPGTNFLIIQPDPDEGSYGTVAFVGVAAFREPGKRRVRAKLTATDPHGASVSVRVYFNISPMDNRNGAPQLDAVPDQNVSVGRPVSLVLPAATGGDMGLELLDFPYAYAVSGLPEGLTFDPETRTVSGMPGETGTFTVTYTADDIDKVGSAYLDPDCPNGTTVDGTACGSDTATQTFTINVRPFIELIRVVSAATHDANGDGVNDTYVRGDVIVVDVEFTEPVELGGAVKTSNTGVLPYDYYETVRARISVGPRGNDGTSGSRRLAYLVDMFHGGKTLRLAYRVQADDHDPDGVSFEKTKGNDILLLVKGATLKGKVSGLDADRTRTDHVTLHYAVNENGQPLTYVSGRATVSGPLPVSATVDGATLSVTFDDGLAALDAEDVAALPMYIGVQGAGGPSGNRNAFQHPTGFALTGDNDETLTMTLGVPAKPGDRVTLSYKRIDHKGPLADDEGNMAPAFVDFAVQNDTIGETKVVASGVTLVGNDGQGGGDAEAGTYEREYATSFTTGGAGGGYILNYVDVWQKREADSPGIGGGVSATLHADNSGVPARDFFGRRWANTTHVTTSWASYRVEMKYGWRHSDPVGIKLEPNTTYWIVVEGDSNQGRDEPGHFVGGTSSDAEDSGGQLGWSLGNNRLWKNKNAGNDTWSAANTNANALRLKLVGDVLDTVPTGPQPLEASVAGTALKIVFDAALDETSSVSGQHFKVETSDLNDDETAIAGTAADATVSGSTVTVTLAEAVPPGVLARVTYDPPSLEIRAAGGGDWAPRFTRFKVETVFDTMAPALTQVGVVQTSENPAGFRAALYFDEALDPDSVPAAGDFSITLDSRDAVTATAAKIEGSAVVLTLDLAAAPEDEEVDGTYDVAAVSYTKGTNPIQDLAGNEAARFTEEDVRVERPGTPVPGAPPGKLVGNTGQARAGANALDQDFAQVFITGSNAGGYTLTHVDLMFEVDNPSGSTGASFSVEIWSPDDNDLPGTRLGTLTKTNPSALVGGLNTFTAPGTGIDLDANTQYFVVVDASSPGDRQEKFVATNSDDIDKGGDAGWDMAVASWFRTGSTWDVSAWERKIAVHGNAIAAGSGVSLPPLLGNTTLVGNDGQSGDGNSGNFTRDYVTSFTTGSASGGYTLTRVDVFLKDTSADSNVQYRLELFHTSPETGLPYRTPFGASSFVRTVDPGNTFTRVPYTHVGYELEADTKYWLGLISSTGTQLADYAIDGTSSDSEDLGGQSGWSIGNNRLWRSKGDAWSASNSNPNALRFELTGDLKGRNAPVSVAGVRLTIAFDRSLDPASVPPPEAFTLRHLPFAGQTDTPEEYASVTAVAVEGRTVVLQVGSPVYPCAGEEPFTVSYAKSATGNNLRTMTGHLADDIDAALVTNTRWPQCGNVGVTASSGSGAQGAGGPSGQGESVKLKFDRPLDRDKALKASAFGLTGTSGGAGPAVRKAAYSADGSGVVLTLGRALGDGETVTVSYTRGARDPGLWDNGGNQIADFSGVEVTRVTPAAVAVVSDAGSDDTYALGETIRVKVTFAGPVTVDTAGGTPRLAIDMDPADWGRKWAAYESGSGTAELVFAYRVAEPNESTGGIAVLADTLEANGGSIALSAGGAAMDLAHAGLGHDPAHKVDWRLAPAGAASVTGVALVSDAGSDDTYALGEAVRVKVTFSEAVEVDTAGGAPRLRIDMDPANWGAKWAAYESGSGTAELVFAYEVVKPNESTRGVAVLADTLEANGGAVRAAAAGTDAHLAHAGLGHDPAHKVDWRLAPAPSGAVSATGVAVVSTPAVGDTYQLGETIRVRVTFDDAVTVDTSGGTPRLKIDLDPAHWGAKWAAYESGSGTDRLAFAYEVVWPNESTKGIAVPANTLEANGGAIRAAGADAHLSHVGLGHDPKHKVDWRPTLSVADAEADEGADAAIEFEVTLGRAAKHRVTVDYATSDGTATAGEDYTATSGTLAFAPGETAKTVSVPLLDDAIDEGEETFLLTLSNADGARIVDGEATGTIKNDDPLQKMWLSRFGRTVASHVTEAVSDRLANPLTGAQVTVGGQTVNLAEVEDEAFLGRTLTSIARAMGAPSGSSPAGDDPDGFGSPGPGGHGTGFGAGPGSWPWAGGGSADTGTPGRIPEGRELLLGSAFHLAAEGDGAAPGLAAWGRVTVGGFDGEAPSDAGTVRIDGNVTTGILGADAEWNRLLAGVAVSVSEGEGTFDQPGVDSGTIESTMTTVSPYARVMVTDRVSVWGLAGWGTGDMTIVQAANQNQPERVTRTDLEMRLAAIGGRGALMQADEEGGLDLALRSDAFFVETEAEEISNEGNTVAKASRVRLILEGGRAFVVGGGATLRPSLELGLRHDGGDAETGTGVELGGGVAWTDADSGFSVEARLRTLIAHEDSDYEEWGASGTIRLDPGAPGLGLSFSLQPTYGATSSATERLWAARDAQGFTPGGEFAPGRRLTGELGYGIALPGGFRGTPHVGFGLSDTVRDWRMGWRLAPARRGGVSLNLDATRREAIVDAAWVPEHELMLRGALHW